MSKEILSANETLDSKIKALAIAIVSTLYVTVNNLVSNLGLFPEFRGTAVEDINFALFIPAASAMIFGGTIGGGAAALGELGTAFQDIFQGKTAADAVHIGTLLNSASFAIGAWLTGFLSSNENERELPKDYKGLLISRSSWKRILIDTAASVVGLAITNNFLYVFGSQLQEDASIASAVPVFLQKVLTDAFVLVLLIPIMLILYDMYQITADKKDQFLEKLARKIDLTVDVEKGSKVTQVKLIESAMIQGVWTPIVMKFVNTRDKDTAFDIEAVSTSKVTPHKDSTKKLKPGEEWTQTFYALPSKQEDVTMRIRITPKKTLKWKESQEEETIVEFVANTRSPRSMINSLLGFSGLNFGILGFGVVLDKVRAILDDPTELIQNITDNLNLLITTAVAELLLFVPLIFMMYRGSIASDDKKSMKLGFSNDIDDLMISEVVEKRFNQIINKFLTRIAPYSKWMIYVSTFVAIGYLGVEGYKTLTAVNYDVRNPELILATVAGVIGAWIVGIRGMDIMKTIGISSDEGPDDDEFITKFEALAPFKEDVPTEVVMTVRNTTDMPGIRIKFEGQDTISPPIIELHIEPNETVQFKVAVTPQEKAVSEIMALGYPLFTKDKEYIPFDEAEPFKAQSINYIVEGQTKGGLSKKQQDQIKKVGGLGAVGAGVLNLISQFYDVSSFEDLIKDAGPYLAAIQAPFAYAYFYASNRFKSVSGSV